jgi:pimeloyl-ACP methyl ester carboxylesterase
MRALTHVARRGQTAPTCIVMLPAAYAAPEDFERQGYVSAVRARALDIDLVFVAPEFAHVTDRSVLAQLHSQIVRPARDLGTAVWLGGVSLGAFVALSYATRHARELAGLCLFAPYLGSHITTMEIERAGGLDAWTAESIADDDEERSVWRFIKDHAYGSLPLHLGLGHDDRFARRHLLLARALPPHATDTVPGGHDWPTWRTLWDNFLDARFTQRR